MNGRPDLRLPVPTFRLRLLWEKGEWSLRRIVAPGSMRLPPGAILPKDPAGAGYCGFWIEILGPQEEVLYRRAFPDPTDPSVELFDKGVPRRLPAHRERVLLDLPVPVSPEIRAVRIHGRRPIHGDRRQESVELATIRWCPLPKEVGDGRS